MAKLSFPSICWNKPIKPTKGYRETVEYIDNSTWFAAGPNGIDLSIDQGNTWTAYSIEKGFHVLRKARNGNLILVAGADGKIGRITQVR